MTELISLNSESATNRLVLLHGWGADANDLLPVGKLLTEGLTDRFEIVSLSAPDPHPSGSGMQWYPLYPHKWEEVPNAVLDLEKRFKVAQYEHNEQNNPLWYTFDYTECETITKFLKRGR